MFGLVRATTRTSRHCHMMCQSKYYVYSTGWWQVYIFKNNRTYLVYRDREDSALLNQLHFQQGTKNNKLIQRGHRLTDAGRVSSAFSSTYTMDRCASVHRLQELVRMLSHAWCCWSLWPCCRPFLWFRTWATKTGAQSAKHIEWFRTFVIIIQN